LHLASPGVEDRSDAEAEAGGFIFGCADVVEGSGAALEEEVVEDLGLMEAEGAEFCGNGEGDEEVRDL
jgi:hypothetical protein